MIQYFRIIQLLVNDGSVDSLEELTENVHQQLNAHFDHMGLIRYENERLRAQLNDKDRIVRYQKFQLKKPLTGTK